MGAASLAGASTAEVEVARKSRQEATAAGGFGAWDEKRHGFFFSHALGMGTTGFYGFSFGVSGGGRDLDKVIWKYILTPNPNGGKPS